MSKEEIVLVTNYIKGTNLDKILFGSHAKEVIAGFKGLHIAT